MPVEPWTCAVASAKDRSAADAAMSAPPTAPVIPNQAIPDDAPAPAMTSSAAAPNEAVPASEPAASPLVIPNQVTTTIPKQVAPTIPEQVTPTIPEQVTPTIPSNPSHPDPVAPAILNQKIRDAKQVIEVAQVDLSAVAKAKGNMEKAGKVSQASGALPDEAF